MGDRGKLFRGPRCTRPLLGNLNLLSEAGEHLKSTHWKTRAGARMNGVSETASGYYKPYKNIVVCCDGSWCGETTGTTSNIKILADSFANNNTGSSTPVTSAQASYNIETDTAVCFFDGVGASANKVSFADYMVDGSLAITIRQRCVEAYRFIVQHFDPKAGSKVYLFGLSRGAHTVRTIAGMINNRGILRPPSTDEELETDCNTVYTILRDRDPTYKPDNKFSKDFRKGKSHETTYPPIRFLGLLDTVGALGVPQLSPGMGIQYEFYDTNVSRQAEIPTDSENLATIEVQTVCQALATHDRMSVFFPCFATRSKKEMEKVDRPYPDVAYNTDQEVWFPGSHYDIGRQRFVFARATKGHWSWEGLLHNVLNTTNLLQINIAPTTYLSNAPLLWMVAQVKAADDSLLPLPAECLKFAKDSPPVLPWPLTRIRFPEITTDAYDKLYTKLLDPKNTLLRWLPGLGSWLQALLNYQLLLDRYVPQSTEASAKFYNIAADPGYPLDNVPKGKDPYTMYKSETFKQFKKIGFRKLELVAPEVLFAPEE